MSRPGLLLAVLALAPVLWPAMARAEQTPEMTAAYRAQTGQRGLDAWLADLNHYVERHPDAFLDALHHGTGIARRTLRGWLDTPGRQAADLYLACQLAVLLDTPCPQLLQWRDGAGDTGWQGALAAAGQGEPPLRVGAAQWQAVREALARDYRHFARPQPR